MPELNQQVAMICPAGQHSGPGSVAEWISQNISGEPNDATRFFTVPLAETSAGPATYYGGQFSADYLWIEHWDEFHAQEFPINYWTIGEGEGDSPDFWTAIADLNLVRVEDPV